MPRHILAVLAATPARVPRPLILLGLWLGACGCDQQSGSAPARSPGGDSELGSPPAQQPSGELAVAEAAVRADPHDPEAYLSRAAVRRRLAWKEQPYQRLSAYSAVLADLRRAHEEAGGAWTFAARIPDPFQELRTEQVLAPRATEPVGTPRGSARALLEAARLMRILGRDDRALELARGAVQLASDDVEARLELASLAADSDEERRQFLKEIVAVTEQPPGTERAALWFLRGRVALALGQADAAEAALKRGCSLSAEYPEWKQYLTWTAGPSVNPAADPEQEFRRLLMESTPYTQADIFGTELSAVGRHDDALTVHAYVLQLAPGLPVAWLNYGSTLCDLGRYREAEAVYVLCERLRPGTPTGRRGIGRVRLAAGDYERAAEAFQQALALAPNDPFILTDYGDALRLGGKPLDGEKSYRRALRAAPRYAPAWDGLARVQFARGERVAAQASVAQMLHHASEFPDQQRLLGLAGAEETASTQGAGGAADREYRAFVRSCLAETEVFNLASSMLFYSGRMEQLRQLADHVLAQAPAHPAALQMRAVCRQRAGDYAGAIADYTRVIEVQPGADAHLGRAIMLYMAQTDRALLRADLRAALAPGPDQGMAYFLTWIVAKEDGDGAAAAGVLAQARANIKTEWYLKIVAYLAGELTDEELRAVAKPGEQRCEAYYYIAEKTRIERGFEATRLYFKRCVHQNVPLFVEHQLAECRLQRGQ